MRNEGRRVATVLGVLPLGWATATIGEIIGCDGLFVDGDWVESKDQDPKGDVRLTQLADVGDGVYRNRSNRFLKYEKAVQLGCTFLQPNDLMVARMPDPLGRACIFPGDSKPSVTAVDVCIVRTEVNGADHQWLMHTINSPTFRSTIASLQSGSTRKRISRSNLAKIEFPLPPLPEQHRIVIKIEELLTRLDAGVGELEKIKAQLSRYRQAVLKHAFEGKLTEEWRGSHRGEIEPASVLLERIKEERKKVEGKLKELLPLDMSDLPELPEGWVWTKIADVADLLRGVSYAKEESSKERKGGYVPILRANNIDRELNFDDLVYVLSKRVKDEQYIRAFDILIAMSSGSKDLVGKASQARNDFQGGFGAFCGLVRIVPDFDRKYIGFFFQSPNYRNEISRLSSGININNLRRSHIESLSLPLSPLPEQRRIVEEIERCFSVANEIEKVVEQSLKQAERLRQSILKRAFEGKLVPQDPTDEPAEKLLEHIRAERARIEAEKKATGKTRRS